MRRAKKSIHKTANRAVLALLRGVRLEAGLTQAALGKRLGRPQTYVSDIEIGERRLDVLQAVEWCAACEIDFVLFAQRLEGVLSLAPRKKT